MKQLAIKLRNNFSHWGYRKLVKPIFFKIDPEQVHDRLIIVGRLLGSNPASRFFVKVIFDYQHPTLKQSISGIKFENPIGLSAGFDKDAELTKIMPSVGFGFEEIGSITGEPCAGNPKPRLWRHPEKKSLRVYYGLKNKGAKKLAHQLSNYTFKFPVGISIAKTNCQKTVATDAAINDYLKAYVAFKDIGDYHTINISCPNAFGGQPFTDAAKLELLLKTIYQHRNSKPIFLKLSPDLSLDQLQRIVSVAAKYNINGFICSNLTKDHNHEQGGLSGKSVYNKSNDHLSYLYRRFGKKYVLIGCGGVFTAEDAYKKIRSGASLIQLITGMIFEGPQTIGQINQGLVRLLKKDGFKNIEEAIGVDVR